MHTQSRHSTVPSWLTALLLVCVCVIASACGRGGGGSQPSARLLAISVTPPSSHVPLGFSQPLAATGIYSDQTTRDLTASVTWSSNDVSVATVSNSAGTNGQVATVTAGSAQITATDLATGIAGSSSLRVTPAVLVSLAITPPTTSLALGYTQQLTATGTFSDRTTRDLTDEVEWSVASGSSLTVSNAAGSKGLATSVQLGTGTVRARHAATNIESSAPVTVTPALLMAMEVTPRMPSVALGYTRQFTATGTFSDNTTRDITDSVAWTSADPNIATVSDAPGNRGFATSVAPGTVRISATDPRSRVTGSTDLTVTAAVLVTLDITPATPDLALGRTLQFTATGTFSDRTTQNLTTQVTWTSSNPAAATISNAAGSHGLATSAAPGATEITAVAPASSVFATTTLRVTPAVLVSIGVTPVEPSIALGYTQQFTATGTFSDNTTQDLTTSVTWTSSNPLIATISNAAGSHGLATSLARGTTDVTATDPSSNVSGTTTLEVTPAVLVSIDVTPTNPSIALGYGRQFTATGTFSDNSTLDVTNRVFWWSSNTAVATVSNAAGGEGYATSMATGSADIVASAGYVSGRTTLTVTPAVLVSIGVTPTNPMVALGFSEQFTATGVFSDNTTQDLTGTVTWSSSAPAIATISNAAGSQGLASTLAVGQTTISASMPASTVVGTTTLDVNPAVLVAIGVTPATPSLALGYQLQFTATGTFSDNTTQDLTATATWIASDPEIATISNAAGSQGLATSADVGVVTIRAVSGDVSGATTLEVTPAVLLSIDVTPALTSIAKGYQQQFTATGTFSDNTTQDLTREVTWASHDTTAAVISNALGSEGLATAVGVGGTTVSATHPGTDVSGSTKLIVTPAVLVSLRVEPFDLRLALGYDQQYTATGTFSDRTTRDLTTEVTWTSNASVAAISNAEGERGRAKSVAIGTTEIRATDPATDITDATALVVTPAELVSIAVTPVFPSVPLGFVQRFTATATFSDDSTMDVTKSVRWSSSDEMVATVSNAEFTEGEASTHAVGNTVIRAGYRDTEISGATTLFVTPAVLTSIAVTPNRASIVAGRTQRFTAMGTFSDSSSRDITTEVTWSSTSTFVATVSNAAGSEGLATGATVGSTVIRAIEPTSALFGNAELSVTDAELAAIRLTAVSTSVAPGFVRRIVATGIFSDGSESDITTRVTWSSSDTSRATVSNAAGNQGWATGVALGNADIIATDPTTDISASFLLAVEPIALSDRTTVLQPGNVSTVTLATPAAAVGDVLIAAIAVRTRSPAVTQPSWTLIGRTQSTNGANSNELYLFRRIVAAGEPTSHTFTLSSAGTVAATILALQGVNTGNIVNAHRGAQTANGLSHDAPSITTTQANTMLLTFHVMGSSTTWTAPTGMTEVVDIATNTPPNTAGVSLLVSRQLQAAAGATGARTATAASGSTATQGVAYSLALRSQ